MVETLFGKIKVDLIGAVINVNQYAKEKDLNRNHVNYGVAIADANVLRELGHKVEIACWEDDGYLKVPKITINEELLNL